MTALLFLIAIASFLFYGVVGEDKTWLLAPLFLFSYPLVTTALLKKAWGMGHGNEKLRANGQQPTAGALLILFLLWGIAMIPQATVPFESKLVMLLIGSVVGAYLVWGGELTTFKDNRLLLGFLIFVVMGLALYGLIIHFRCPERILWTERYTDYYEGRLMSTYICPNHFAHLMQMLMPFCAALLFIPQTGIFLRLLAGYSLLVFLPPLFLTESRAGWLGSIVGVGVVACLMALRRSKKLFLLLMIFVPLCSTLILFAGWRFSETFQRRATPVVEFLQHQGEEGVGSESKDFRPQTWMDTIDMIKEAPLIGFGPGNYRYTFPEHRNRFKGRQIVTGHPHNEYLELIADYGLIGFALFALAWIYGLIRILIASLKAEDVRHAFIGFAFIGTAAGTMVHSFFDFEMHVYPNALVFALLAAMAWGPLAAQKAKGVRRRARDSRDHERQTALRPGSGQASGVGMSGEAAVECGGSTPLSDSPSTFNQQPSTTFTRRDNGGQKSAASSELLVQNDSPTTSNVQRSTFNVQRLATWLLAIGYLSLTILCLQTMSSAFIRAMADKKVEALVTRRAPNSKLHAQHLYELSARIDAANWRAYKGMADLLFNQRYYSLDMAEKVQLAGEERGWYEKTYAQNPKDPEICTAWGKALIFLGRAERKAQGAERMAEVISRRDSGDSGEENAKQTRSVNAVRDNDSFTPAELIDHGLELLHEACRYRPFNDVYWWTLGVELRKLGRYEEALDVFKKAQSIRRTPTTVANIKWIEKQMALRIHSGQAGVGRQEAGVREQESEPAEQEPQTSTNFVLPDPTNATPDAGLMDLLDKMNR